MTLFIICIYSAISIRCIYILYFPLCRVVVGGGPPPQNQAQITQVQQTGHQVTTRHLVHCYGIGLQIN